MSIIPSFVAFLEKKIGPGSLLTSFYSRSYYKVIQNEITLANITSRDRVLNIGCGGIPYTALQIATLTGAKVWAIDRDKESINSALNCISSMKLENRVKALTLNGTDHIFFEFDVAIVALQSEPKKKILENLIKHANPGTRLVFRRPRSELCHQYDPLPEAPQPDAKVYQKKTTFDCSVLYKVEEDETAFQKKISGVRS